MEKFETLLANFEQINQSSFPKFLRRRLDALKKIQYERLSVEREYHRELQALEMKYAKLYEPFNERRAKIVKGEHEPTDEECKLPPEVIEQELEDQEEEPQDNFPRLTDEEEKEIVDKVKGIPYFWLGCLTLSQNFEGSIMPHDKPVLKHLNDISVEYDNQGPDSVVHKLVFHFDKNPYFTNKTLTKTYHLKLGEDTKDPFSFDGHELVKNEGCTIDWIDGKDLTVKTMAVKQKNKKNGSIREKEKNVPRDSFFHFFSPQPYPSDDKDTDSEVQASIDFELAEILRQNIIPKAVLYFTGILFDDEDDMESFDGDDMDDDEEEDGDSFEDESLGDQSDSETDSDDHPLQGKSKSKHGKREGRNHK